MRNFAKYLPKTLIKNMAWGTQKDHQGYAYRRNK